MCWVTQEPEEETESILPISAQQFVFREDFRIKNLTSRGSYTLYNTGKAYCAQNRGYIGAKQSTDGYLYQIDPWISHTVLLKWFALRKHHSSRVPGS